MPNVFCYACPPYQEQNDIAIDFMQAVEGMEDVNDLIVYIDQLINEIGRGFQEQVAKPNSVATSINSGGNLIQKLSNRLKWHAFKKCLLSALDRQTRKLVIEVLNQTQIMQFVGMALSIIAHLLERAASSNEEEHLHLLRYMSTLAKHMRNLNIHLERRKLGDILCFIVKATVICALQMEPGSFHRFSFPRLDAADIENFRTRLVCFYPDLEYQAVTEVLNRLDTVLGPSEGEYPQDAVGIEKAQEEVIKLLDMKEASRRAVVIYGIGGIGKTTLATGVFNRLDLTDYHYCRVDMDQDSKQSDLQTKQEQMLRDLFKENLKLNNFTEGRQKLREAFGKASKPLFLFIDNALRHTDLEMLLPIEHLSGLPMLRKILVTSRNFNEANIFRLQDDIQVYSHRVDPLSEPEAKRLLCHYALGDKNGSFGSGVNIDGLLRICGGIPLVLRIVGSKLHSDGNTVSVCNDILKCNDILEYLKEWQKKVHDGEEERNRFDGGEEDISKSMVDFVYKQLRGPSQEAFLDIAFFFCDWDRSKVRDIVGEMQLDDLEGAALVTTSEGGKVKIHEIVKARGRKLSEGNRIIDKESLCILLNDVQKIQQIKGIWIPNDDKLSLEAKQLDLMSEVLSLGNLSFLQVLIMDDCSGLPQSFGNLSSLQTLLMDSCERLQRLPESFGNLSSLQTLRMDSCSRLKRLPESFGNLSSLQTLSMDRCWTLERLPESFGNLSSLQTLSMDRCWTLERLPESFGNLSSLQTLSMNGCGRLKRLPIDHRRFRRSIDGQIWTF